MINILACTHKGAVRSQNQDSYDYELINDKMAFVVVCDGMGGENAGDVASKIACETIREKVLRAINKNISLFSIKNVLESAVSVANSKVYDLSKTNEKYEGMGTTVIACITFGDTVCILNAGDSRAYSISKDKVEQITKDHTLVQSLIDAGEITPIQAKNHPQKHYITRALGVSEFLDTDYMECNINDDNYVLICTDGLSNYIDYNNIYDTIHNAVLQNNTKTLIDYALEKGGADNITAVVLSRRITVNG